MRHTTIKDQNSLNQFWYLCVFLIIYNFSLSLLFLLLLILLLLLLITVLH